MLRAQKLDDGDYEVHLPPQALELLWHLPRRLRNLLESPDFEDRVVRRLFPVAYDDEEKESEYRELLGDDLRQRKLAAIDVFEEILRSGEIHRREAHLSIPAERFDSVLGFINDMRLLLGVELDITDDNWQFEISPDHPRAEEMLLLDFLGFLQHSLLEATGMADLEGIDLAPPPEA